jgi:hypothetical protein
VAQHAPKEAEMLLRFARQFLEEGYPLQAAWHARRSVAVRKLGFFAAWSLQKEIERSAGAERERAKRMFWHGPVRTLELQPG